jgi:hypothetical protein
MFVSMQPTTSSIRGGAHKARPLTATIMGDVYEGWLRLHQPVQTVQQNYRLTSIRAP